MSVVVNGLEETQKTRSCATRVLHVISGLFYGGGQRVVLDLLKSLPQAGDIDARLCTMGDCADSPLAAVCGSTVAYDGRYNSPRVLLGTAGKLRKVIASEGVDIVHTHGLDADLIGAVAVRRTRARHVCHLHISPPANRQESWKAAIRRKLLRYLTGRNRSWFIAVSDAVREQMGEYYNLPRERIVTIRNGIDPTEFDGTARTNNLQQSRRTIFGTAARLAPMKGLEYLIRAAGRLRDGRIDFELRIAGTGSQQEELQNLAASLGLADEVRFVGQLSDMAEFYRDLDVFVLPSVSSEGLPLVVLEAMAMGRPIVATRLAGTPEVVRDEIDGLLVPPADVESLAEALGKLANDSDRRCEMGKNGQDRIGSDFRIERVAREVSQLYARVLAEK
jgi:glycosyltransferase involved in cell wall biosynthesis